MPSDIITYALAIIAVYGGVVVWRMCARLRSITLTLQVLNQSSSRLKERLLEAEKKLSDSSSVKLAAEVADLAAAVDMDRKSVRKQFGKVWGTIGAEKPPEAPRARPAVPFGALPLPRVDPHGD